MQEPYTKSKNDQILMIVNTVKRQLRNYARMRELVDRWIEAATELADLRLEEKET